MARAIWKGSVNFGLVAIPVELAAIDNTKSIDLDMLDKTDHAPIHFKRVNAVTGKEVPWPRIVKGYKTKSGDYVILEDEDFKRANVKATQTIDIINFVDVAELNVAYYEKPYFMVPEKGGQKSYELLRRTLLGAKKAGMAKVVIRQKQHLAAIVADQKALTLEILRFPDELRKRDTAALKISNTRISPAEVKMAKDLVASMSATWNPKNYKNTYHDDLMKMINYKIKHGDTTTLPEEKEQVVEQGGRVLDLMPLLKRSLAQNQKGKKRRGASSVSP